MKHFLTVTDFTPDQIQEILNLSTELNKNPKPILAGKNILFVFEKPSLRTMMGTESAINKLGGNVIHAKHESVLKNIHIDDEEEQQVRESFIDTFLVAERYVDAIFGRVFRHDTLKKIADIVSIPVINALCNQYHPMQALGDMFTIQQKFGPHKKIKLAFVGDANNVCFSLFEALLLFGHTVSWSGPTEYSFPKKAQQHFHSLAQKYGGKILFENDPKDAVKNADIVYTDAFISMGEEDIAHEKIKSFHNFQVTEELLKQASPQVHFMHCLPAHRGIEVTDEVIDGPSSWIYDQAGNRTITSLGLFAYILKNKN